MSVFNDILGLAQRASGPWWVSQAMIFRTRFDRGDTGDVDVVDGALSLLEKNYPEFDQGRFGVKALLSDLGDRVRIVRAARK